jgi:hypothetical protein
VIRIPLRREGEYPPYHHGHTGGVAMEITTRSERRPGFRHRHAFELKEKIWRSDTLLIPLTLFQSYLYVTVLLECLAIFQGLTSSAAGVKTKFIFTHWDRLAQHMRRNMV